MVIKALNKTHDRHGFNCGNTDLNNFLRKTARQAADKNLSRTFVLTDGDDPRILGFFAITPCAVNILDVPEKERKKYPPQQGLPAVRLARLAVGLQYRGKGFGEVLLAEAMSITVKVAESVGAIGLFVDAKDETAKSFYEKYGFAVTNSSKPLQLFLPLASISAAL